MFDKIYDLPIETLALLTAIVFVGSYWIGCFLLRPVLRIFVRSKGGENDIVGTVLSAFGVFYGLLLSLIAVAAYQNLNQVGVDAANEAAALLALYRDVSEFPAPYNAQLCPLLREYCRYSIEEEWPVQRQGIVPFGANAKLAPIRKGLLDFEPQTKRDEMLHAEAFKHFEVLLENGRHRRFAAQTGIPTVMWYVVIVGTIINFALMWLFEMRFVTQLFLGGLLAFFLGALILLIAVLDRPYRSAQYGVSPEAHQLVYKVMMRDEASGSVQGSGAEGGR